MFSSINNSNFGSRKRINSSNFEYGIKLNKVATDFINRVKSENGTLSQKEITAVHWLCGMYNRYSLFDKVTAMYLFVGGSGATDSSFTASQSGTTLTVTAVSSGTLAVGQVIVGTSVNAGSKITALGTGTGTTGTYILSESQTLTSRAMTGSHSINNFTHNLVSSSYRLTQPSLAITATQCLSTGWQGTGTGSSVSNGVATQIWDTGIVPNTDLDHTNQDIHMSASFKAALLVGTGVIDCGCVDTISGGTYVSRPALVLTIRTATGGGNDSSYYQWQYAQNNYSNFSSRSVAGLWTGCNYSVNNANNVNVFNNGASQGPTTVSMSTTACSYSIYLGALHIPDYTNLNFNASNRLYTMFSFGKSFTSAEEAKRAYIHQQFDTMLGRQATNNTVAPL